MIAPLFTQLSTVAGRRRWGARPATWRALEDKTLVDRIWRSAGLPRARSLVVPAADAAAFMADRADRVRVMPFLDGIPCSVHDEHVADVTVRCAPSPIGGHVRVAPAASLVGGGASVAGLVAEVLGWVDELLGLGLGPLEPGVDVRRSVG